MFDLASVRRDFPILSREVHGQPLVYLDNAATSQKPTTVIDSITDYYDRYNSNVHRGVHTLSGEATDVRGCPRPDRTMVWNRRCWWLFCFGAPPRH